MRVRISQLKSPGSTDDLRGVLEETVPGYRFGTGALVRRLKRGQAVTVAISTRGAAEELARRLVALGAAVSLLDDATLADVRATLEAEHLGHLTGDDLIDHCTDLGVALGVSALASNLPEVFWHYLSDADLRLKDPRYAAAQRAALQAALASLS